MNYLSMLEQVSPEFSRSWTNNVAPAVLRGPALSGLLGPWGGLVLFRGGFYGFRGLRDFLSKNGP